MTDITSLIERLVAAGADPVVAACVVAEAVVAGHSTTPFRTPPPVQSAAAGRMNDYRDRREAMGLPRVFQAGLYRPQLIERDGEQCIYCEAAGPLVIDHIHPSFLGGGDDLGNLGLACRQCNGRKAGKPLEKTGMTIRIESARRAHEGYKSRTVFTPSAPEQCSQEPRTVANTSEHVRADENAHISYSSNSLEKKESKKERVPRKRNTCLPDDWAPSLRAYQIAEENGVNVQIVEQIFRDYLKSSGKLYADYDAAFYNFLRNQRRFNGNASHGKPQDNPRSGSLIGAIDRRLAALAVEAEPDTSLSTDHFLGLPNRSIQRS